MRAPVGDQHYARREVGIETADDDTGWRAEQWEKRWRRGWRTTPVEGRSDDQTIAALRREVGDAAEDNKIQTDRVHWIMLAQVVASLAASMLALVSVHLSYSQ